MTHKAHTTKSTVIHSEKWLEKRVFQRISVKTASSNLIFRHFLRSSTRLPSTFSLCTFCGTDHCLGVTLCHYHKWFLNSFFLPVECAGGHTELNYDSHVVWQTGEKCSVCCGVLAEEECSGKYKYFTWENQKKNFEKSRFFSEFQPKRESFRKNS